MTTQHNSIKQNDFLLKFEMNICVLEEFSSNDMGGNQVTSTPYKINKCALKLLGLQQNELSDEEILEFLSQHVQPSSIEALVYDSFHNFYVLFLKDIESTCSLIDKSFTSGTNEMRFLPLLETFIIDNVYPYVKNEELRDAFRTFGNVFEITNSNLLPNSSRFSHVLSGKREISFLLPGEQDEIIIPINVIHPPYSFHVKKLCCACLTEGHSILNCPDKDDDMSISITSSMFDSDSEIDTITKQETIPGITVKQESDEDQSDIGTENNVSEKTVNGIREKESGTEEQTESEKSPALDSSRTSPSLASANHTEITTNGHFNGRETRKRKATETEFDEENQNKASRHESRIQTTVVSSSQSINIPHLPAGKGKLSNLEEAIIDANVGILPGVILKCLLRADSRNKNELVTIVMRVTENLEEVVKQLKNLQVECIQEDKYADLVDSKFSRKLLILISVFSKCAK